MAKEMKVTIPLELEISKDAYGKLATSKKTQDNAYLTGVALSAMCSQFLDAYANGGVLVRPDNVKKLEAATGAKIESDVEIVQQIQKANNRDEGENAVVIKIDPALYPALEEYAKTIGWDVKDVMQDITNRVVRDSLAFYVNGQSWEPVIYMTQDQGAVFEKMLGKKHYSGKDILDVIDKYKKELERVQEEVAA